MKGMILITAIALSLNVYSAKDPVVATVNGTKILKSELDLTFNQNLLYVSDQVVTREKVLDDLINRELGIQRARKRNLQKDDLVKRKMEDVLYHAQISKDLEPRLKKLTVTDEEVAKYYNENPEYRTAHILLRVRALPSKKEEKAAMDQAFKIHQQLIKDPSKFAEFANKFSQSATAQTGGDMGFQPAVKMAPEYYRAIKGKANNFITPPVRTQFGFHIVKVLAKKELKAIDSNLYKKIVYDKKRDAELEKYFSELRKSTEISINKQHLDYNPYREEKSQN